MMYILTENELLHRRFLRGEVAWAERKLREASDELARYEAKLLAVVQVPARKVAVVSTLDGIDQTISVHDKLADARIALHARRYHEMHCTEGNGYTGASYRLMRGTGAGNWVEAH